LRAAVSVQLSMILLRCKWKILILGSCAVLPWNCCYAWYPSSRAMLWLQFKRQHVQSTRERCV